VTAGAGARARKGVCVEGFADACRKGGEGVRRREEVVASPVRVGLRRS
jgi:hypothetical protein